MDLETCTQAIPRLRGYELLGLIAEGSMASVYRGRRWQDGQPVAIKVPHPAVADNENLLERFRLEYRAGRELDHPNIVRTLDFGQEGGTCYLVLELVEGSDLWRRIERRGRLPEAEAVAIIVQAARGLHEAHKHGIIHRDVKPDNILLSADGQAKLGDLGLIKELEGELNLTCPHKGLGTPNFMSPEQFTEACRADVRFDIYSLGATLYMAVTGVLPFQGKNLTAVMRKKLNSELPAPRALVPGLSETVDWAIRRALQLNPECRQASCLEFIESLSGKKKSAARPGSRRPSVKEKRQAVRYPCAVVSLCELATSIHPQETTVLDRWEGQVVNLSATGLGLVLSRRFESGTVLGVVLENSARTFQLRADVRVIRSLRSEKSQWFLGAAFTQPLAKESLRKLLWNPSHERT
jgi:serine/threonine protein kinase